MYVSINLLLFSLQFGEIVECRVIKVKSDKSNKAVAFVQFNSQAQAKNGKHAENDSATYVNLCLTPAYMLMYCLHSASPERFKARAQ